MVNKSYAKISLAEFEKNLGTEPKNDDSSVLFQEYGQSDKILNNFCAASLDFLVRQNYSEFCQTSHIPKKPGSDLENSVQSLLSRSQY